MEQGTVLTFKATCSRTVELAYANVLAIPMHTAIPARKDTCQNAVGLGRQDLD